MPTLTRNWNQQAIVQKIRNFEWKDSYAQYVLGGVILVVVALLITNFISSTRQSVQITENPTNQTPQTSGFNTLTQHKVEKGESVSLISQKYYGTIDNWKAIARANNLTNPNLIIPGQTLTIPTKESAGQILDGINSKIEGTSYTVMAGETLWNIAERAYGDGNQWTKIFEANHLNYLPNGEPLIHRGNVLIIPRE